MCDSTGRYEETGGALAAPGGPQSLFFPAHDALPLCDGVRKNMGKSKLFTTHGGNFVII